MYGAFPPDRGAPPAPVELWPLAAEHLTDSCDIGSGAAEIGRKFSSLDVSKLPEVWWYTDEETSREDAFASRERYREYGFMEPELTLIKRVDDMLECTFYDHRADRDAPHTYQVTTRSFVARDRKTTRTSYEPERARDLKSDPAAAPARDTSRERDASGVQRHRSWRPLQLRHAARTRSDACWTVSVAGKGL